MFNAVLDSDKIFIFMFLTVIVFTNCLLGTRIYFFLFIYFFFLPGKVFNEKMKILFVVGSQHEGAVIECFIRKTQAKLERIDANLISKIIVFLRSCPDL
jgi:hypothetical protein